MRLPAFTIIELILVMAILAIIGTSITLSAASSSSKNILNSQAQKLADTLRIARISSRESKPIGTTPAKWGLALTPNSYQLVTDPASDRPITPVDSGVTLSPVTIIWFANITGNPSSTPTITLQHSSNTKTITISSTGLIAIH